MKGSTVTPLPATPLPGKATTELTSSSTKLPGDDKEKKKNATEKEEEEEEADQLESQRRVSASDDLEYPSSMTQGAEVRLSVTGN